MLKTTVLSARNVGFSLKKRRFLKLIRIFASIKTVYPVDYQRFSCNAQNKRFSQLNDNTPANIGCMCGQNRLFVEFIHIYRRGMILSRSASHGKQVRHTSGRDLSRSVLRP